MSAHGGRSRDVLADVETSLLNLARRWESTPPGETIARLRTLERQATVASRGRVAPDLRRAWERTHARLLCMSAAAHADAGVPAKAVMSARMAVVLARHVGDATAAAHAGVILAELAAYSFNDPDDGLALAQAARAAAPASHTAVLALVTEANIRASRRESASEVAEVVRAAEAVSRHLPAGTTGYSLDTVHPGHLASFGGAALLGVGAMTEGQAKLAQAAELFEASRSPGALAAVHLYQAAGKLSEGGLDESQALTTQALATAAVRPTQWLTDGIRALADRARRLGADWSGLVAQAQAWAPPA